MNKDHWIIKAIKYAPIGTIIAFLSLLLSITLGAWVIYTKMTGRLT